MHSVVKSKTTFLSNLFKHITSDASGPSVSNKLIKLRHSSLAEKIIDDSFFSHKLIRTNVLSFEQASKLQKLEEVYDFWRPARSGLSTDIMVGPLNQKYLYNLLVGFIYTF